jgi:copper transport protein
MLRALIAAIALVLVCCTGAMAHAGLIGTDPADSSVLSAGPSALTLTFTEPVSPIGFSLVGVGSAPVPLTQDTLDGPVVKVTLPAGLAKGSYLFSWRVTSVDGHPVNGTVGFAVGAPSGTIAATAGDPLLASSIWLVRTLQYVALFFGVGSLAFGLIASLPKRARQIGSGLSIMGLVLVPVAIGLQGLDLLGLPLGTLFSATPWPDGIISSYAETQGLLALAFVLSLAKLKRVVLVAAVLGALAPVLSGHASTAEPQGLMRAAVFVHMASLLFWLGALLPLALLLREGGRAALQKFSRVVPFAVVALVASGATLAIVQLGPPEADWFSFYGVLLWVKLALVALLLLLALWNRVRLTAPALAGETAPLRRSIVVELGIVLVILGVVAAWRFTPPPRVLAEVAAASAPAIASLTGDNATGTLVATPGHSGPLALALDLSVAARAVTVKLANPGAGIATISRPATPAADKSWHVDGLELPVGGNWSVDVEARTGDFDLSVLHATLALAPPAEDPTMLRTLPAAALASSMLLSLPAAAADSGVVASCATGQSFTAGDIVVTGAYSRATLKGAKSAAGYLLVTNHGSAADTITGATTAAASTVTMHSMKMNGNVMEMAPVDGGLEVPAGGTVSFDPMGYHLMLTGMNQPFVKGQCLEMTLHFAKAGDLPVELNIGTIAQSAPVTDGASSMAPMDMSGMSSMEGM